MKVRGMFEKLGEMSEIVAKRNLFGDYRAVERCCSDLVNTP